MLLYIQSALSELHHLLQSYSDNILYSVEFSMHSVYSCEAEVVQAMLVLSNHVPRLNMRIAFGISIINLLKIHQTE